MQLFNRDLAVYGRHAEIIRKLRASELYADNISIWVEAAFTGLYHGKKAEKDNSSPEETHLAGRTYFQSRSKLANMLFVFLQQEKKYQKRPLTTSEVFLIKDDTHDIGDMINELEEYALYGLEVLEKEFDSIINETNNEIVIGDLMLRNYHNTTEFEAIVEEESADFYLVESDSTAKSLFKEMRKQHGEK